MKGCGVPHCSDLLHVRPNIIHDNVFKNPNGTKRERLEIHEKEKPKAKRAKSKDSVVYFLATERLKKRVTSQFSCPIKCLHVCTSYFLRMEIYLGDFLEKKRENC